MRNAPGQYVVGGFHPGLLQAGNINLWARPPVRNPDGSVSTVRTISIGVGGHEVLIPTVVGGRVVSTQRAITHFRLTGQHLGIFNSVGAANRYAQKLHTTQAQLYSH